MSQGPESKHPEETGEPSMAGAGGRDTAPAEADRPDDAGRDKAARPREVGGRKGLDPTRYGDWEKNGRCIDF